MATIKELKGDLFKCPIESSIAHCVSKDLKMGAGIAKIFRYKFGRVDELKKQCINVGNVAILEDNNRFIYYLVTKEKYWQKPTYKTLTSSLNKMKEHCIDNKIKLLSLPLIGCGLDRLKWENVLNIIKNVFNYDITINIYNL